MVGLTPRDWTTLRGKNRNTTTTKVTVNTVRRLEKVMSKCVCSHGTAMLRTPKPSEPWNNE